MTDADIGPVAGLYRAVWIHRGNYLERLDPGAPGNFEHAGGMFRIQDERGLAGLIRDESEFVWVAKDEDGEVLGAFWCGLDDPKYQTCENIRPPELGERLARARAMRALYFSKEILVAPGRRGGALAEALFYAGMRHFFALGYKETCGEVYRVRAVRDERGEQGERAVNLYNNASHNMLLRTGGRHEGAFAPVEIRADGFDASITMQIMTWELASALLSAREALRAAGVSTWEEQS
jgi:GNAT superfamily N-acetyltransferase